MLSDMITCPNLPLPHRPVSSIAVDSSQLDESARHARGNVMYSFNQFDNDAAATCSHQLTAGSISVMAVAKLSTAFRAAHIPIIIWGSTAIAWSNRCSAVAAGTQVELLVPFDHVADNAHLQYLIVRHRRALYLLSGLMVSQELLDHHGLALVEWLGAPGIWGARMALSYTDPTSGKSVAVNVVFGSVDGMHISTPVWDKPNRFLLRCRYASKGFEKIDYYGELLLAPKGLDDVLTADDHSAAHCVPYRYLSMEDEPVIAGHIVDVNALCDAYTIRCVNGEAASDPIRQLLAFVHRTARENQLAITLSCVSRAYSANPTLPKPLYAAVAIDSSDVDKWAQILNDSRRFTSFILGIKTGNYLRLQYSRVSDLSVILVASHQLKEYRDALVYPGLPEYTWNVPPAHDPAAAILESACDHCDFCIPVENSTNTGSILHGESQACLDSSSSAGVTKCSYNVSYLMLCPL